MSRAGLLSIVLVLLAGGAFGADHPEEPGSRVVLTSWIEEGPLRYPYRIDFGQVGVGEPFEARVPLTNRGDRPLRVERLSPT